MSSKFGKNYPMLGTRTIVARSPEREKVILVAAGALVVSLVAILLLLFTSRSADKGTVEVSKDLNPVPAAIGTVTLLTPDRLVRAGSALGDVTFKEIYWPRNQVPEGAVRDVAELRALFAKNDMQPGTPVLRQNLTREQSMATLPVTPGNRAVAISIDDRAGIEGHALPGTRVDVVLTFMSGGQLTSKVIVQNAIVLSLGGDTTPFGRQAAEGARLGRRSSNTITLDVTPGDALQLQTARQLGTLSLIMRALDDNKTVSVDTKTTSDLEGGKRGADGPKKACAKRGQVRIDGKQFVMDCDGSISQLVNPNEP